MNKMPLLLSMVGASLVAQDATERELLDLLNTPVTVASAKATTLRESPGVITVLNHEEIQASGARDLIDVLRLVPGFDFSQDGWGSIGLTARGLWAYEGKVLVLMDGIEIPELLYGTTSFGHRFPVDQIKRIEIIRGPGSATYGGLAELAVIKIITLQGEDLSGSGAVKAGAGVTYGTASGKLRGAWNGLMAAQLGGGTQLTLGLYSDEGRWNTEKYAAWDGAAVKELDGKVYSGTRDRMVNLGVTSGGFSFRTLMEKYELQDPNTSGALAYREYWPSVSADLRYQWKVSDHVSITPIYSYRRMLPWSYHAYRRTVQRDRGGIQVGWDLSSAWSLNGGLERYTDSASIAADTANAMISTDPNARRATYGSTAAYAEVVYRGLVNITVGGRYENHSSAGSSVVPRFALTWVGGAFHVKALFAGAFRSPNVQNLPLNAGDKIVSEKTQDLELEVGFQSGGSITTLTFFNTKLEKPLVYSNDGINGGYLNGGDMKSQGLELDWKLRQSWGFVNASASFHLADSRVPEWSVPDEPNRFLGTPATKATLLASIRLGAGFTLSPSVVWMGNRFGYVYDATVEGLGLTQFPATTLLNLQLTWNKGPWTASLAVFDLADKQPGFVQAYSGGILPQRDSGREVVAKVRIGF